MRLRSELSAAMIGPPTATEVNERAKLVRKNTERRVARRSSSTATTATAAAIAVP
jgi:hypothetical protein